MKRGLLLAAVLALAPLGRAQTAPPVGITPVTVTWSAPSSYAPMVGVATAAAVATTPPGTLTDGTYPVGVNVDLNGQAFGLEASVTVTGGAITAVAVTAGGQGYASGDTETFEAAELPGATANGTLRIVSVTNPPAVPLPASDVDHYTVWWAPADGPGHCTSANCVRGPYGIAEVAAGVTSYTIAAACGNLAIEVRASTNATAHAPFAMSNPQTFTESTGVTCPVLGAPGAPKLSWPKA